MTHPSFLRRRLMGAYVQPPAPVFAYQDVGDTGWTYPATRPTVVAGANRAARLASTETGSRIYYIDADAGTDPVDQTAALSRVYFWNGTDIIDADGSTTGAGGVAYGTNPHNPTGPVLPFKSWAMVAPKNGGTEIVYNQTAANISYGNAGTSQWRSAKPDWWLFKRGVSHSIYDDVRRYMNLTARSATAVPSLTAITTANGGNDASSPAVVGCWGAAALGRAELKHPIYAVLNWFGGASTPYKHVRCFGLTLNGEDRDRNVQPVDWGVFATDDYLAGNLVAFSGIGVNSFGLKWEDCHFLCSSTNVTLNAEVAHTVQNADYDWTMHRCLVTDSWAESTTARLTASKAAGDPDQTIAANTEGTVTWPTETTDSDAYFVSPTYTLGTSSFSWKFWPLMKVVASINVGGTLRVSLFKNGAEVDFYTLSGTGVASDTYDCHRVLRPGFATQASGSTFDIRINSTGATSSVEVKGTAMSRLVISRLGTPSLNGVFAFLYGGSRVSMTENVFSRCGFGVNPRDQTNYIPNGVIPRFDWDTLNHNLYLVGDGSIDVVQRGNVSLIGAAGDLVRHRSLLTQNFFYQGYVSISHEQKYGAYSSKTGECNDNILQRFKATTGTVNAHPAWGFLVATGCYNHEVLRNIVSDVHADGTGDFAVKVSCLSSPYAAQNSFVWKNDVIGTLIDGNIFDSTHTDASTVPLQEANGATRLAAMWKTTVTGTIADGQIITATPAGTGGVDYTGTPSYEWRRFTAGTDTSVNVKGPSADNTYTLVAANNDFTNNTDGVPTSLVVCLVTGITYATGNGISGTLATNNVVIKPVGKVLNNYYSADSSATASGADVFAIPPVPAASNISTTGTVVYATRAAAASALGWTNPDASIKTHLQNLGVTVTSGDGFVEYDNLVVGAVPVTDALRYGQWDDRFLGKKMGNHVRTGRGMAAVT